MDWKLILTSTVLSTLISVILGGLLKAKFDSKLEKEKQVYEIEKVGSQLTAQKDIELLKNSISQLNALQQKNLDYYHISQQASQSKRLESIDAVWKEYLNRRIFSSPIINFMSVLIPTEYIEVINSVDETDSLNLKSLDTIPFVATLDSVPQLFLLETYRPFLGSTLYYKFRSAFCILYRLRFKFEYMKKKQEIYNWNKDALLIEHLDVIFMESGSTEKKDFTNNLLLNPNNLQQLMSVIEKEINDSISKVISGEESANLSLEWAEKLKKLSIGYSTR